MQKFKNFSKVFVRVRRLLSRFPTAYAKNGTTEIAPLFYGFLT